MKIVTRLVIAISFMFTSIANADVILSITPSTQEANPGSSVSVTVMIDGLGDGIIQSLSAFDLLVEFDPSVLSFTGYNLFEDLGVVDPSDPLADAEDWSFGAGFFGPNLVHIAELSYLENAFLDAVQPASFALAELFFTVNPLAGMQTTNLSIYGGTFVNTAGVSNVIPASSNNASIDVPAPTTLVLMGLGLLTMFGRQKRYSSSFKNLN